MQGICLVVGRIILLCRTQGFTDNHCSCFMLRLLAALIHCHT